MNLLPVVLVAGIGLVLLAITQAQSSEGPQAQLPGDPSTDPAQVSDCTGPYYNPGSVFYDPTQDPCNGGGGPTMTGGGVARPGFVPDADWAAVMAASQNQPHVAYLIAAIGWHETNWGTNANADPNYILGIGVYGPGNENPAFTGLAKQLAWVAPRLLAKFPPPPVTLAGLEEFDAATWRAGDPNWPTGVYAQYVSEVAAAGLPSLAA